MKYDGRKIIHVDMDAFYASVEQRDRPELRGKPVIVGGVPGSRGVVATCSYEARVFGIHSAMPSSKAYHLCPQAIFVEPRFDAYQAVSDMIRTIFHRHTDLVEAVSLDEAYLDVTENFSGNPSATRIAMDIKKAIRAETALTASAGVSYNKFLSKVASDFRKPDGLTVIPPEKALAFIAALPIGEFHGVGRVTEEHMLRLGIRTGADLRQRSLEELLHHFGKSGEFFYQIAQGNDLRLVEPYQERKSLGKETTLDEDIQDPAVMKSILAELSQSVQEGLREEGIKGRTITLKLKYDDFQSITRSLTFPKPVDAAEILLEIASSLLSCTEAGARKVRLLGISVGNLSPTTPREGEYWQPEFDFGDTVTS